MTEPITEPVRCRGDAGALEVARLVNECGIDQYRASLMVFADPMPPMAPPPWDAAWREQRSWVTAVVWAVTAPLRKAVGL